MGVLLNAAHERFCQAVHDHMLAGDSRGSARTKAYRETIVVGKGKNANDPDNARRLSNLPHVKARIQQIADDAARVAGINRTWFLVKLSKMADGNLDDYLSPPDAEGNRYFNLSEVSREKMGLLAELTQDQVVEKFGDRDNPDTRYVRKIKLKLQDQLGAMRLMSDILGYKAPEKHANTDTAGNDLPPVSDGDRAAALAAFLAKTGQVVGAE